MYPSAFGSGPVLRTSTTPDIPFPLDFTLFVYTPPAGTYFSNTSTAVGGTSAGERKRGQLIQQELQLRPERSGGVGAVPPSPP